MADFFLLLFFLFLFLGALLLSFAVVTVVDGLRHRARRRRDFTDNDASDSDNRYFR